MNFNCPECLLTSRFDDGEELQRCSHCGAFHQSEALVNDGWVLEAIPRRVATAAVGKAVGR